MFKDGIWRRGGASSVDGGGRDEGRRKKEGGGVGDGGIEDGRPLRETEDGGELARDEGKAIGVVWAVPRE